MGRNSLPTFFLACAAVLFAATANAAEIRAFVSIALKSSMDELTPAFEKATGHTVKLEITTVAALKKRIDGGEAFDVAVLTPAAIDDLIKEGKAAADTRAGIARAGLGAGIRTGGARPDLSSTDAFKKSLQAAKSIGYTDPALGGASGVYMGRLLERLGLADELKSKTVLTKGSAGMQESFTKGEVEIGFLQISELLPMSGVEVVGPLPAEIQNWTSFAAAVASATKEKAASEAFLKSLTTPAAAAVFKAKGLEPGA